MSLLSVGNVYVHEQQVDFIVCTSSTWHKATSGDVIPIRVINQPFQVGGEADFSMLANDNFILGPGIANNNHDYRNTLVSKLRTHLPQLSDPASGMVLKVVSSDPTGKGW